jgi:hypothetical protein
MRSSIAGRPTHTGNDKQKGVSIRPAGAYFTSTTNPTAEQPVGALVVENDRSFDSQRNQLMGRTAGNAIRAIYHIREFPAAGGLMS